MSYYKVNEGVFAAIMQFLDTQTYKTVKGVMPYLESLKPIVEPEKQEEEDIVKPEDC